MKSIKTNQRIRLEINSKMRERERESSNSGKKNCNCKTNFSSKFLSLLVIIGIKREHIYI